MLDIKTISFKNILSYGNTPVEIDFNQFKSLYISGKNGSGKSVIIEAIFFVLYGKPYRRINIEGLVNKTNKKNLWVKVDFTNGGNNYTIERGIKPKILKVTKNGEPLREGVSKKEFQKQINDIIGVDSKTFNQLCLVDNTFYKPFMQLSIQERRSIIDSIFGLNQITDMGLKTREYKSKINEKIEISNSNIEMIKEKIKLNKQFTDDNIKKEIDHCTENISMWKKDAVELLTDKKEKVIVRDEKVKIKESIVDIIHATETIKTGLVEQKSFLEHRIKDSKRKISVLKTKKCNNCGSTFQKPESKIKKITDEIYTFKSSMKPLNSKIKKSEKTISESNKKLLDSEQECVEHNKEIFEVDNDLSILKANIENEKEKLSRLQEKKDTYNVSELESELKESEKKYKTYNTMFSQIRRCETILSDGGIRSYIVRKFLPGFNKTLKKYLGIMEAGFHFEFDSEFNQKMNDRIRNNLQYDTLSSGQKSRINLAILFSFIEFAEKRSNSRINILIFDETIDGIGLDTEGKDQILAILKHLVKKKMVVISHDASLEDSFDKCIKVELKGMSKVEWK
jgi:DNA repair exonuclease SbcCD ATPase subunit